MLFIPAAIAVFTCCEVSSNERTLNLRSYHMQHSPLALSTTNLTAAHKSYGLRHSKLFSTQFIKSLFLLQPAYNLTNLRCIKSLSKESDQTITLLCSAPKRTKYLLYKYCTICTTWKWSILTVITQKLLLPDKLHNRKKGVKLITSAVECRWWFEIVCIYIENHIEWFHLQIHAKCRNFYSDKEQVDVTKITNTMCKLKANWSNVSVKCRFVWMFFVHAEFYCNVLTLLLVIRFKYLPSYSKRSIYITVLRSVMCITTTFRNTQPTTVPISVINVDTWEHTSGTGTLRWKTGQ